MIDLAARVDRVLRGTRPLPLVLAGDPVLRTPASPYDFSLPDDTWVELIAAMRETMRTAPGVGLAAPQIGLGIRVAVLEDPAEIPAEVAAERQRYLTAPRVLVNPEYERVRGEQTPDSAALTYADFYEGCLSVPGYQAVVRRATTIRLCCRNERGDRVNEVVTGWPARIVAHETDHLDGILYLDRALTRSLTTTDNLINFWSGTPVATMREILGF